MFEKIYCAVKTGYLRGDKIVVILVMRHIPYACGSTLNMQSQLSVHTANKL